MRDRVFISYRRSDERGAATAVRLTLEHWYGKDAVFQDVSGLEPGAPFPDGTPYRFESTSSPAI